jgi:hypothetical protein
MKRSRQRLLAAGRVTAAVAASVAIVATVADRLLAARGRSPIRPLETRVEIAAPIDAVWAVLSDVTRQPEWMREMKAVRILSPGPVRAGTEAEATVRIFGIAVTDPVVVTEYVPPRRFAIRHLGRFAGGGELTLREGVGGGIGGIPPTTVVEWREVLVPPVLPYVGSLVQWPVLHWIFQDDLYRLRDLIEDAAVPAAAGSAQTA